MNDRKWPEVRGRRDVLKQLVNEGCKPFSDCFRVQGRIGAFGQKRTKCLLKWRVPYALGRYF